MKNSSLQKKDPGVNKPLLKAKYGSDKTPLIIGNIEIPCYVLEDGTAVLSGRGIQNILGFKKSDSGNALTTMLNRSKFETYMPDNLMQKLDSPIQFERIGGGGSQPMTNAYEATVLIDICYVLIDAKRDNVKLTPKEEGLYIQAELIVRAFSKTGIISVIYKLTGYLDDQVSTFLNDILNKFLLDEAKKYKVTFPLELYKQWYRLNNWDWKLESKQKRPGVIGTWTKDLIYSRIAPLLLKELERKNPKNEKGYREFKHFQFLTDEVGEPQLREFFGGLIALAKASPNWRKYYAMVNRAYPKFNQDGSQIQEIPFEDI